MPPHDTNGSPSRTDDLKTVRAPEKRVAVLTNLLAPYRIPVFARIAQYFDVSVFLSGAESNRQSWATHPSAQPGFTVRQSSGWSLPVPIRRNGRAFDLRWVHLNPGYLADLVRTRPDAVISGEMGFRTLCALMYGALFRRPVWIWWGGTLHTERRIGAFRRCLRSALSRWAPRWVSYGRTSTEYLLHLGVCPGRIVQLQNCVNGALFQPRGCSRAVNSSRPLLLYVGQMIGRKGIHEFLESASRLQAAGRTFSILLVGSGPQRGSYEQQARQLGLCNVQFQSALPPEEMAAVYRSADCLVFPTLEDVWGLVVNEALLCGVPVVSSVYAGCTPEIVPLENRFDPLNPAQFDAMLRRAIDGELAPVDTSCLKTVDQVADLIIDSISRELHRCRREACA